MILKVGFHVDQTIVLIFHNNYKFLKLIIIKLGFYIDPTIVLIFQ